jgi:hypothetical protein
MMKAACATAWILLATAVPALGQTGGGTKSPSPTPERPMPAPPPAEAEFDVDTYTCQDVLDDLAAKRQNRIGIAILVIYAQLRAASTPDDHRFSLATIERVASAAGASCAGGTRERLLRDVVAEQVSTSQH